MAEVVKKQEGALVNASFEEMSGLGFAETTTQDMFVINLSDVLTMSESCDVEMICYYEDYVSKVDKPNHSELNRKMGYLGTVEETKKNLEKLFKAS